MGRHLRTAVLVALFTGGLAALPTSSEAQNPKQSMHIGLIAYGEGAMGPHLYRSLIEGLRKQGDIEGRNLVVERRYADAHFERVAEIAKELGIVEDITTELSRFQDLFVIARNSSFRFKGQASDVRQVARELGVRYVLEGSVRRDGDQVRISAQLIDAITGGHRWAEPPPLAQKPASVRPASVATSV